MTPRTMSGTWLLPVEVRQDAGFQAAVLSMRGSYAMQDAAVKRLYEEMNKAGTPPLGPFFTRYLNDPAQAPEEALRWEVGRPIFPSQSVRPPLELRKFEPRLIVTATVRCSVDETPRRLQALMDWIAENGYQPTGESIVFWIARKGPSPDDPLQKAELIVPVVRVAVVPVVLRDLVCISGLSLFAVFLLSRLRRSSGRLPLRGGGLWVMLGVSCALAYIEPLLGDLGYLYGDFLPDRGGRWALTVPEVARGAEALAAALVAHLLFRLMLRRLPALWIFRAWLTVLYAAAVIPTLGVALRLAPAVITRAEQGGMAAVVRNVALALFVIAMLVADRLHAGRLPPSPEVVQPRRGERLAYLGLSLAALGGALCSAFSPDAMVRQVSSTVMLSIPIPFLLATAYFHERAAVFDVLAKRGIFVLAALLALTTYFALVPGRLWSARMGWVGSWVFPVSALPFVILAPWVSGWLSARLDRHWLGRALSPAQASRFFLAGLSSATTESELLHAAEERLGAIFPSGRAPDAPRRTVEITLSTTPSQIGQPSPWSFEAPVVSHGVRVGTMRISTPADARPFLSEDQALFSSLGEALGLALEALGLRERKLAQERAEQELRVLASRAELKALRAQINPHFVFNALNAIAELIASDPVTAEKTVERLAEVLRHTLRRSDSEWVRVDEELASVRAYLEVERIRFGLRLEVRVEAGDDAAQGLVPAMMMQTLVENAVKHGVARRPGPARIEVRVARRAEGLRVEVRDTGPGFPAEVGPDGSGAAGVGLKNVRERLRGHFGDEASLTVGRDEAEGSTVVAISLPFLSSTPSEQVRRAQ